MSDRAGRQAVESLVSVLNHELGIGHVSRLDPYTGETRWTIGALVLHRTSIGYTVHQVTTAAGETADIFTLSPARSYDALWRRLHGWSDGRRFEAQRHQVTP